LSSDEKIFVVGGSDSIVIVYRIEDSIKEIGRLIGHTKPITCVEISVDYSIIVSIDEDGIVAVWDLQGLKILRTMRCDKVSNVKIDKTSLYIGDLPIGITNQVYQLLILMQELIKL